jgi:hypothetical protein
MKSKLQLLRKSTKRAETNSAFAAISALYAEAKATGSMAINNPGSCRTYLEQYLGPISEKNL